MSKSKRLPPMEGPRELAGVQFRSYCVGDWCPTPDGSGPPQAVALSLQTTFAGQDLDMVLRLKSPRAVDELIQSLLRHKRSVWPEAG